MATQIKRILIVFAGVIATITTFAWLTGQTSHETIVVLAMGFLVMSAFYFVLSLLIRLPFLRLRAAFASLLSIILVLLAVLYTAPLLEHYRLGHEVSKSLFHPIVFASLGLGILALTQRK